MVNKGTVMTKTVDETDVKFIEIGSSGKSYCLTLSKNALLALREGKTFPIELLDGDVKKLIVVMRDTTFKKRMTIHNKISKKAKESVETKIKERRDIELGKDIGSSS